MSKSYLSTLSLIMSFLITVCAVFVVPDVLETLGFDSIKLFFTDGLKEIGKLSVLFFAVYLASLVLNLILKALTVTFCKKILNLFVMIFDVAFMACCVFLLLTEASLLLALSLAISLFAVIFDFLFFYAQM